MKNGRWPVRKGKKGLEVSYRQLMLNKKYIKYFF